MSGGKPKCGACSGNLFGGERVQARFVHQAVLLVASLSSQPSESSRLLALDFGLPRAPLAPEGAEVPGTASGAGMDAGLGARFGSILWMDVGNQYLLVFEGESSETGVS